MMRLLLNPMVEAAVAEDQVQLADINSVALHNPVQREA